jgi:hypothetical protein
MWLMAGNFVGRREFLRRILTANVQPDRQGRLFILQGIPGSGKTELLDQLERAVEKQEGSAGGVVIDVRCADYETPGGRRGTRAPDEAAEFRQLTALFQESLPDMVDGAVSDTLHFSEARPGYGGPARARGLTGDDPGNLLDLATEAVTSLCRDLAERQERVLVIVDDFHLLAARPLGDWVLDWLVGIKGADIVVTRLPPPDDEASEWPSHAVTLALGNLRQDEVLRYLAASEHVGPEVAADIVGPVWEFTGGHPQALVLVADLIRESGAPGDAMRTIRQVGALDGELAEKLEELVERIFRATHRSELRQALYSLCSTRYFDTALIMRLLGVDKAHAGTLVDQMRQFSFVTDAGSQGFLTISPYVRHLGRTKHTDGSRRAELHEAAAEYFHGLIRKETEEDESWAETWYHLEDKRFQILKKEWLYHVSRLTGSRRRTGRLEIARLFLDGFWWWGFYVPFPFCEEILADWLSATADGSQESEEDRQWGQALRALYSTFPKGNRLERATRAELITVRRYLRQLWDRGALGTQEDNAEARHVRGIIDVFLADILRYLNPMDPRVDEALADAARLLAEDDDYIVAWIDVTRDDLHVQREQWAEAMSLSRQAVQRHAHFGDHELLANFHRIHADALWARGEAGPALDGYARAVLHAYALQLDGHPDPYTNAFQQEMIDRCLERMAELRTAADGGTGDGRDEDDGGALTVLHGACARIRAFFAPYWEEVGQDTDADVAADVVRALAHDDPAEAAGMLFPALAPVVDTDLTRTGTEWELIRHDVLGEMPGELAALPGTPLA